MDLRIRRSESIRNIFGSGTLATVHKRIISVSCSVSVKKNEWERKYFYKEKRKDGSTRKDSNLDVLHCCRHKTFVGKSSGYMVHDKWPFFILYSFLSDPTYVACETRSTKSLKSGVADPDPNGSALFLEA